MIRHSFLTAALSTAVACSAAFADGHGIALYGEPALPADYEHLPQVNPDAPKGGVFADGQVGSFDSLNPHIQQGRVPWQLRFVAYESLMGRAYDEPFTLYGLLAERVEVNDNDTQITYTLHPEARFSDGTPVTVEDVIWSWNILGQEGAHGRYRAAFDKVKSVENVADNQVRFSLDEPDRELLMSTGLRPIMKKSQWEGREDSFFDSGVREAPISSAPYVITDVDPGRYVVLTRDEDYWGDNLPFRRGTNNIDTFRMEFFGDATAHFEAFKAGELSTMRETNAARWARDYDFPAVQAGDVVKSEVPHQRPSGMTGFVMNTRRAPFDDWRVRQAMIEAFNFEYINGVVNAGVQPRITSYFSNSPLGMETGAAEGRVADLLAPFADDLLPGTIEGYELPVTDGRAANRRGLRRATALLEEAGYVAGDDGRLRGPDGPVSFEILLPQGSSEVRAITDIYTEALERLGIDVSVATVDSAQFKQRTAEYEFDMTWYSWGLSLSPGNEQLGYWGPDGVTATGSRNLMGTADPAIVAMIDAMLSAESRDDYVAAVKALDRVLTAGRYVVPSYHNPVSYIAHDAALRYPADRLPIYGDWIGFQPDIWWFEQ
ncbi:extracellular solute-binding protein [Jannaschia aquimarina]|uniref:AppA_1 protein n=1 Tax=Jannaschia aquimarina TaxID=935700 RepID=A0A0D1EJ06_9RHOB|nr:extracellular solute-binding protein [Jannaschia aquimarina]KIT16921.1 Oligopeptide-binding protein AppA precursor [Jannaschia aquimarina]SNT11564.1 peptide/nickel transport system substrate-binding protein [Jannaschia aquimarina]